MHICLIWTLLVRSILGRFLLPYWDVSFVHLNTDIAQLVEKQLSDYYYTFPTVLNVSLSFSP
jgi:hypothetical protein